MGKQKKEINCKIYSINYLMNEELTEDDLYNIFESNSNSLHYSLILEMLRTAGDKRTDDEIIHEGKTNKYFVYDNRWTKKQYNEFKEKLIRVFENLYSASKFTAERSADDWLFNYALTFPHANYDNTLNKINRYGK